MAAKRKANDTAAKPHEGKTVETAATGSDGRATFATSDLATGTYRIRPQDLTMRTVDIKVNTPTPTTPAPGSPTPTPSPTTGNPSVGDDPAKSAQVKVKSVAKKSQIKIDVNPDDVAGPWKIVAQKKTKKGWKKAKRVVVMKGKKAKRIKARKLTTSGSKNLLVINPKKGIYRITVPAAHGYTATTSKPVKIRR